MSHPKEDRPDQGRPDEDTVAGFLAAALERIEAGERVDLEALCRERPECIPDVAAALGLRHELPDLNRRDVEATPQGKLLADRYQLVSAVGSGAAGTVWQAVDQRLHRDVAVKLLHRGLFTGSDSEARFHREAIVLAGYEHPHIVRIYDQGQADDGTSYLVTELLRGASLATVLQAAQAAMPDGPSSARFSNIDWLRQLLPDAQLESSWLRQAVRWIAQLGEGLQTAHADEVCHRDVKPGNAFVRTNGDAVLLDFGIATRTGDASITRTQTVLGTPCYMAPEQAAGQTDPRPALDIYGLTATLYHLLTLRPPHDGDLQTVLVALQRDEPIPAFKLCRGLPRDLQAILDKGLERTPQRRYATMQALVSDLHAFLDHAPVTARAIGRSQRAWRRIARRPARAIAVTATVAALLIGGIGLPAWRSQQVHAANEVYAEQHRRLPADICIEGWPDMRPLVPIQEQDSLLAELDDLIDHDKRNIGIRVLRAASLLDFGHLDRAQQDFDAIVATADSAYLRELAQRYRSAKAGMKGRGVLDLEALPEPSQEADYFLAGFHALRNRDCETADTLLSQAEAYLPARDLRLLAIVGKRNPDPHRAIQEAAELEGIYGHDTARTQHVLAVAHLQLQLFDKAIPFCLRSLELRPDRHGPWTNLGFAHLRLNNLPEAKRCYEHAVALRAWLPNSLSGLSQTLRELGDFAGARDIAKQIGDVGWREYELGSNELHRALLHLHADNRVAMEHAAELAKQHFLASEAQTTTTNPKRGQTKGQRMLAVMLANGQQHLALAPLLHGMRADPRNPRSISNLALMLGDNTLNADALGRLRLWLLDLTISLAPENPDYRTLRANLLKELQAARNR